MKYRNAEANPLLLVATEEKAKEILADSNLSSSIHSTADSTFMKMGMYKYYARAIKSVNKKIKLKSISLLSETEVLEGISANFDFGIPIKRINPTNARSELNLGPGHHPSNGSFYMKHPIYQEIYLPAQDFSKSICTEKEAAFQKIAASLGAKSIKLESIQSNKKRSFIGGQISAKEIASDLGINVNTESDGSIKKQVFKEFNKPKFKSPFIPNELLPWVDFDPDLRTMAFDRLEANARKSIVKLEFSQSLGLGGEITAKLASRGISFGGSTKLINHSIWSFEVEYYEMTLA